MQVVMSRLLSDLAQKLEGIDVFLWDATEAEAPPAEILKTCEVYVPTYMSPRATLAIAEDMPNLRLIQLMTAGVDAHRGKVPSSVTLCNAKGVHDASTAELAVALILASKRGIPKFVRDAEGGKWESLHARALADSKVMILGYGSIGRALESRLVPFEVEIVRVARSAKSGVYPITELEGLLGEMDVVVVVVPLTDSSTGLVDTKFLARMKDGALLVNLARGPVVVTKDLVAELKTGRLSAALDVTDPEPLPPEHPLWQLPNCLISPHVGGNTSAFFPRIEKLVRDNLTRYQNGEPLLNVIDGDY